MKVYWETGLGLKMGEVVGEVDDNGIKLLVVKKVDKNTDRLDPSAEDHHWIVRKSKCTSFIDKNDIKKALALVGDEVAKSEFSYVLDKYLSFKVW